MDRPSNALEAIEFMIDTNVHRYNRKQIAMMLRPHMKPESAKAWLTKCLDPETDLRFTPDDVDRICAITGRGDIYLGYLADQHGFERPAKKVVLDPATAEKILRQALRDRGLAPDDEIKECIKQHKPLFSKEICDQ